MAKGVIATETPVAEKNRAWKHNHNAAVAQLGEAIVRPHRHQTQWGLLSHVDGFAPPPFSLLLLYFCCVYRRWGVTLPINQDRRLGDMIDAEQAAALCEALTGLDAADVSQK